jgi:hypothetical protein
MKHSEREDFVDGIFISFVVMLLVSTFVLMPLAILLLR